MFERIGRGDGSGDALVEQVGILDHIRNDLAVFDLEDSVLTQKSASGPELVVVLEHYHKRPRDSQIAAHISTPQSGVIESRELLQHNFQALYARVEQQATLDKPEFWGGYRLQPDYYEFWQGRPNRLHDRLVYEKTENEWQLQRLMP